MKSIKIEELTKDAMRVIDEGHKNLPGGDSVIPTGIVDLDLALDGGLQRGNLYLLRGRPGCGKTSLACDIACRIAAEYPKKGVAFFTMETDTDMTTQMMLSHCSGVPYRNVRSALLTDSEYAEVEQAAKTLVQAKMTVLWGEDTIDGIYEEACDVDDDLCFEGTGAIDVVIVDYLELIKADNGKNDKAKILKELKSLAQGLNAPVIVMSTMDYSAPLSSQVRIDRSTRGYARKLLDSDNNVIEPDVDVLIYLIKEELDPAVRSSVFNTTFYVYQPSWNDPAVARVEFRPEIVRFG